MISEETKEEVIKWINELLGRERREGGGEGGGDEEGEEEEIKWAIMPRIGYTQL